jgi:hypothetical protein
MRAWRFSWYSASVEERLKEAERLYKTGFLSEAEYQEKRQALIKEL